MACGNVLSFISPIHIVLFKLAILIPRTWLATVTFNITLNTDNE